MFGRKAVQQMRDPHVYPSYFELHMGNRHERSGPTLSCKLAKSSVDQRRGG